MAPEDLHAAHVYDVNAAICDSGYSHATRFNTASAAIRLLKRLERYHGAPALSQIITRHPGLRPRNVTATDEERERILVAAPLHLRLFTLLCSDLAIRSGTAVRISPENYDPTQGELHFTTKLGERLTLPITAEIKALIGQCDLSNNQSFVRQLHTGQPNSNLLSTRPDRYKHTIGSAFRALCHSIGITRKLTPHDFRRTTAVRLYEETGDARDVQALLGHRSLASTIWYLDHDLRPVKLANLEYINRPRWEREKTA
jgi:integrase